MEFLRTLLNLESDESFTSCLGDAAISYERNFQSYPEHEEKVSVVPFLSGERSIGFRGRATGCILGLTRNTRPSDLMRSCLESVILRLKHILLLIESSFPTELSNVSYIVSSGNALDQNCLWRQMLSDCTGKKVVKDNDGYEGTSRGVAVLISNVLLNKDSADNVTTMIKKSIKIVDEKLPNPLSARYWLKQRENQDFAIECLTPMWQ